MLRMLPLKCCILSCPAPQISCDSALGQELSQSDYFFFFFFYTVEAQFAFAWKGK